MDYAANTSSLDPTLQILSIVWLVLAIPFLILFIIAAWKLHSKAGRPGWHALIPVYNFYEWLKIVKRPGWWLILFILPVPFLAIILSLIVSLDSAKAFGRSSMFGIFLLFLFPIGYFIMAFGKSKYQYGTDKPVSTPVKTETRTPEVQATTPKNETKPETPTQTSKT